MGNQDSWWTSLCRETHRQTGADERFTPAAVIGVSNCDTVAAAAAADDDDDDASISLL